MHCWRWHRSSGWFRPLKPESPPTSRHIPQCLDPAPQTRAFVQIYSYTLHITPCVLSMMPGRKAVVKSSRVEAVDCATYGSGWAFGLNRDTLCALGRGRFEIDLRRRG